MLFLGDDNEMFNPYCSGNGDTVYRLLSGWLGNAETIFMLFFIVLWQGLFIWLFSQIRKNGMCRMSLSLVKAFGI